VKIKGGFELSEFLLKLRFSFSRFSQKPKKQIRKKNSSSRQQQPTNHRSVSVVSQMGDKSLEKMSLSSMPQPKKMEGRNISSSNNNRTSAKTSCYCYWK
jgi:hypothetical protein